jgi:2-polyprenyl-3-methyl-5-hydroxy-6-metoxy-1,4-benzoquinol methylase
MANIQDDRGFNQVWGDKQSTRIRAERRYAYMISQMGASAGQSVLEIGCGRGKMSHAIARATGMQVLGTDLCAPFVEAASAEYVLPNLGFEVLDFNDPVTIAGRRFDFIVGDGILHHLYYNLDSSLAAIYGLLKPGGRMLFWEPNILNIYCALIFKVPYFRRRARLEPTEMAFSRRFIEGRLVKAGFQKISVRYKDFLIPGVPDILITPSIVAGNLIEPIPLLNTMSQSLFIQAGK